MTRAESVEVLDDCESVLRKAYIKPDVLEFAQRYPREQQTFALDYDDLVRANSDLADDILEAPDQIKEYFDKALQNFDSPDNTDLSGASVRVTNLPNHVERDIGTFRKHDANQLRLVRGQVTKKTETKPKIEEAVWECQRCGTFTHVPQSGDMTLQEPHECEGCERQGPFRYRADQSERVNYQRVRVQVPPEKARGGGGESLDVDVDGDLVETVEVGDRVKANLQLRVKLDSSGQEKKRIEEWYAEGEELETEQSDWADIDITDHLDRIKEIAADNPMEKFVNSILPAHYGDEHIKRALVLQMFTGGRLKLPDGSEIRGDSHMLLIGDPGTNKTGMLKYAKRLYPRSVFTAGNSASGVGLTAAAVRDDFGGDQWSLEGGAMVRAHKGLAAIDELDKMSDDDRGKMFEALSDQSVSVSKAGINATLPCETKLLAAANPIHGRFNQHEAFADQFDLNPAFMSRFDLIFTVSDSPDEGRDAAIASSIGEAFKAGAKRKRDEDLSEELADSVEPELRPEITRPYIAHAKELTPMPTEEAMERIRDEYVSIRNANEDADGPVPVTARKIEAMYRLAFASARLRLSDEVTLFDAKRAISVIRDCLEDVGVDPETEEMDADIVETGMPKSQKDRVDFLLNAIDTLEGDDPADEDEVIKLATDRGMGPGTVKNTLESLSQDGKIYGPDGGWRTT